MTPTPPSDEAREPCQRAWAWSWQVHDHFAEEIHGEIPERYLAECFDAFAAEQVAALEKRNRELCDLVLRSLTRYEHLHEDDLTDDEYNAAQLRAAAPETRG